MTKKELCEKYSFLKNDRLRFECREGWLNLIDETFAKVKEVVQKEKLEDFKIVQIKNKMGRLRIYENRIESQVIRQILNEAEKTSMTVCEMCGGVGELKCVDHYWIVLCKTDIPKFKELREAHLD
jgi:hypothetical protein